MNAPWPDAAHDLARAVTRRERLGALLISGGAGTLGGAVVGSLGKLLGVATPAWVPVAAGALLGVAHGLVRARRVIPADLGAAAWALDRVGQAGEAGLASALSGRAHGAVPPPATRLKPVAGLPLVLASLLAAGLALGLEARSDATEPAPSGGSSTHVVGQLDAASTHEAEASGARERSAAETQAAEAERVRLALGLANGAEPSPEALSERLRDPAARAAAQAAAEPESPLARALAQGADGAAYVGRGLAQGEQAGSALEAERRAALAAARSSDVVPGGASRRALIERHAALLRAQGGR